MTTQTVETSSAPAAPAGNPTQTPTARVWKAREIQRLVQLPLDSDDPAPARTEALIDRLNNRVKDLPGDRDVSVTEDEDIVLKAIQRCEGRG